MTKVVEPERQSLNRPAAATGRVNQPSRSNALTPASVRNVPQQPPAPSRVTPSAPPPPAAAKIAAKATEATTQKGFVRRDAPIAKPLPSVNSADSDVNWVG